MSNDLLSNTNVPTYNIRKCTNILFTDNRDYDNGLSLLSTEMVVLSLKVNRGYILNWSNLFFDLQIKMVPVEPVSFNVFPRKDQSITKYQWQSLLIFQNVYN